MDLKIISLEESNKFKDLAYYINKALNNGKLKDEEKLKEIEKLANQVILHKECVEMRWAGLERK